MFYYLNGTIAAIEENLVVVDCGGIGFACHTTSNTIARVKQGQKQLLYTYCNIREDAFDIFGFSEKSELECFGRLLGVSGVGPKAALAILSVLTPDRLTLAVLTEDEKALTAASGVGKKMAQRVILELKDKLSDVKQEIDFSGPAVPSVHTGVAAEASAALSSLGFSQSEIGLALRGIDVEHLSVQEVIKAALKNSAGKQGRV